MNKWMYVLGAVLIAGFGVLGVMEMLHAQAPYVTAIKEVRSAGRPVQFQGSIVSGKTAYDESADELTFVLRDSNGDALPVRYKGVKPANFDSCDRAVVRGTYASGEFNADKVLLKCPSKYQGESRDK